MKDFSLSKWVKFISVTLYMMVVASLYTFEVVSLTTALLLLAPALFYVWRMFLILRDEQEVNRKFGLKRNPIVTLSHIKAYHYSKRHGTLERIILMHEDDFKRARDMSEFAEVYSAYRSCGRFVRKRDRVISEAVVLLALFSSGVYRFVRLNNGIPLPRNVQAFLNARLMRGTKIESRLLVH